MHIVKGQLPKMVFVQFLWEEDKNSGEGGGGQLHPEVVTLETV